MNHRQGTLRAACAGLALMALPAFAALPHGAHDAMDHGAHTASPAFDEKTALATSQAAIGRTLENVTLRDTTGKAVKLADYRGKPLVISLIYTSCHHICPTTTRHLARVVREARAALGDDSFHVVTIGFDVANDNPEAMRVFAKQQGVSGPGWDFLSADAATIAPLTKNLGFQYFASPKGFDHLMQATIVDATGRISHQVYGMTFEMPMMIEPLKQLVLGEKPDQPLLDGIWNKVKLFCTTYDPTNDRYRFDYSLFLGMLIGALIIAAGIVFLVRGLRQRRAA
jgi:protein SCO1/2